MLKLLDRIHRVSRHRRGDLSTSATLFPFAAPLPLVVALASLGIAWACDASLRTGLTAAAAVLAVTLLAVALLTALRRPSGSGRAAADGRPARRIAEAGGARPAGRGRLGVTTTAPAPPAATAGATGTQAVSCSAG